MMNKSIIKQRVKETIRESAAKEYVKSISLFGSYLHENNREESDIDLILDMKKTMSLFKIADLAYQLEKKLGKKVDLVEKDSLSKFIRKKVLADATKLYEYQD